MFSKIPREEYIKLVIEKYLECERRYFGDCSLLSRRPQKRDLEAMHRVADEKLKCSAVLEAIEEGSKKYKERNPRIKRIPAFAYFLKIAEIKAASVPAEPFNGPRLTKKEDNEKFIKEIRALIQQLGEFYNLPPSGQEALREAAGHVQAALDEALRRREAGEPFVEFLMEAIGKIENDFHREAREGLDAREDRIIWLRQAADAKSWLDRYERTEPVTTWLIVNRTFKTLGIPVNWLKGL